MRLRHTFRLAALAVTALCLTTPPASAAVDSFFDIFTEHEVTAPPYPAPAILTISGTNFGGAFHATQQIEIELLAMSLTGFPPGVPTRAGGGGGGAGGSPPAVDSFFDIFIEVDLGASTTGRKIGDIRIVHPPGRPPGTRLMPVNPSAPPGSVDSFFDIFVTDSFFDITYRVADETGDHTYHSRCASPSGRVSFFDVFVELRNPTPHPDGTVDSFFDVFVDFTMNGPRNGQPDMRTHTTGQYSGGVTPAASHSWGRIKQLYR